MSVLLEMAGDAQPSPCGHDRYMRLSWFVRPRRESFRRDGWM
ncbi:hypothetical protein [Cupriavidus nantongensis]